jgi:hypothetical protein
MADNNSDYVGQIFNLANAFAVPFAQKIAGSGGTSEKTAQQRANDSLQEIANNARLNGSGPNDPNLALASAPTSLFDFINGKSAGSVKTQGGNAFSWALIVGLLVVGFVLLYKSKN